MGLWLFVDKNLLLVDDEQNILASLRRLFRRDGYNIFTAANGPEGLAILKVEDIGVIVSDQRMPEMLGSDFLALAKILKPDTIRIILSGYTELTSVTDAINQGAVFKFLTKPWDDELLREHVRQAFVQYEMSAENQRLNAELKTTNATLSDLVQELELRVAQRTQDLSANLSILRVDQEILDTLPAGVIGIAEDGLIVTANKEACRLFGDMPLTSIEAKYVLPEKLIPSTEQNDMRCIELENGAVEVRFARLGSPSDGRGWIVMLIAK